MEELKEAAQAVLDMFPKDMSSDNSLKMGWSEEAIRKVQNLRNELQRGVIKLKEESESPDLFIVRLYDGFDNIWIDVSEPTTKKQADAIWNEKTDNGKKNTAFEDIDYYKVFPAGTRMLRSAY